MSKNPSFSTIKEDELLQWMCDLRDFLVQYPQIGSEVDLSGQSDSVHLFLGDDPAREDAQELIVSFNDITQTFWVSNLSLWREECARRSRVVVGASPIDNEPIVFRVSLGSIDDVIVTIQGEYRLG